MAMLSSYYHHQDLHHRHCHYHGEDFCHCLICLMMMMKMISDQAPGLTWRSQGGLSVTHCKTTAASDQTSEHNVGRSWPISTLILSYWFGGIDYSFIIMIKYLSTALSALGDELSTKFLCSLCSIMLINYLLFQTKAIHKWWLSPLVLDGGSRKQYPLPWCSR